MQDRLKVQFTYPGHAEKEDLMLEEKDQPRSRVEDPPDDRGRKKRLKKKKALGGNRRVDKWLKKGTI